jgi:hypothetical protein
MQMGLTESSGNWRWMKLNGDLLQELLYQGVDRSGPDVRELG